MVNPERFTAPASLGARVSRERNERGRYVETVSPADVLAVFEAVDGPVVTSADVADRHGCSRDSARGKLAELEDRGRVESRKTAGRLVYWRTDADGATPGDTGGPRAGRSRDEADPTDLLGYVDDLLFGGGS